MKVVLAEDNSLLREGLIRLLEAHDCEVCAAVADGDALAAALLEHRPDVAVVDIRMPPTYTDEGLRAVVSARDSLPSLPVLVLSQYVEQLYARELLRDGRGAVGYLLKDRVADVEEFITALQRVASGGTAMDPEVIAGLLGGQSNRLDALTAREQEVLALMAEGRSNAAIAAELHVSEKAVGKHSASLFRKLDLNQSEDDNRRVLAVLAYLDGRTA
ncbi:response regulator [Haloglycomyces albus]|uniref:response regulator n=1 Tax=Haloglycomyces albus TaxID=526067 RepID=UPI00046D2D00|nr:response regulator transcription factor [Haloglycomyces albus]